MNVSKSELQQRSAYCTLAGTEDDALLYCEGSIQPCVSADLCAWMWASFRLNTRMSSSLQPVASTRTSVVEHRGDLQYSYQVSRI
jgi:hypothetical protein